MLFLISFVFTAMIACEIFLQARYFWKFHKKRKKIVGKIKLDADAGKYSCDLISTHRNQKGLIGYALIPNSSAVFTYPEITPVPYEVKINPRGLRDEDVSEKDIGSYFDSVIIFLGDSVTFGSGLELRHTFVKQCQRLLRELGIKAYCLNFAVGGYSVLESVESVFYQKAEIYKPRVIIYNFTIKSIFDAPRINDPLTGYHMESRRKLFLAHKVHILLRGGKKNFLYKTLKKLDCWCRVRNIKFVINFLPALQGGKLMCLATRGEFELGRYPEALDFMELIRGRGELEVWDFSRHFLNRPYRNFFRKDAKGRLSDYEVHFSAEGSRFIAGILADRLRYYH